MKSSITTIFALLFAGTLFAQTAFIGKGDIKFQVGANLQSNASGITLNFDHGVGENISIGLVGTYLLGVDEAIDADFGDRVDLRARFNANLGNVLEIGDHFDVYPGLSLGLKNFGGHLGARYFFTDGFGIFAEAGIPIAKYNTDALTPAEELNNQFVFSFGASFNL